VSRLLRAKAIIDGRKYITKPKPKRQKKRRQEVRHNYLLNKHSLAPLRRIANRTKRIEPWRKNKSQV
jgi:hypothetical protein